MNSPARATPRTLQSMVLPYAEPSSGAFVVHIHLTDSRVPVGFPSAGPPYALGAEIRTEQCPDGRHLWDAVLATGHPAPTGDDDADEQLPFRLALTCLRCGLLRQLRGLVDDSGRYGDGGLDPVPLRAGQLLAQQIRRDRHDGELTTWAVHDHSAGLPLGAIGWSRSRRGRLFYVGVRYSETHDVRVEAPTPITALRKLARLEASPDPGAAG